MGKTDFTTSMESMTDIIFGGAPNVLPNNPNVLARSLPINRIYPDPKQPRRALPTAVRRLWNGHPTSMGRLYREWMSLWAKDVEWQPGAITTLVTQLLHDDEYDEYDREMGKCVLGKSLLDIVELASSIRSEGLKNPITVAAVGGDEYRIETGERRWLAYHLLHHLEKDAARWETMPAQVVARSDIWSQAAENNNRRDLSAIGKARQLALLIMNLHGETLWKTYAECGSDREFYAQVADGEVWRVPRGEGERVLRAMGLRDPNQISHYRALLRADDDLWQQADDEDWTEFTIRVEMKKRRAPAGDTLTDVRVSDQGERDIWDMLVVPPSPAPPTASAASLPGAPGQGEAGINWRESPKRMLLQSAYRRAESGVDPWFSAQSTGHAVLWLNKLVSDGLLEGRTQKENVSRHVLFYRIAPGGCTYLGRPVIQYAPAPPGSRRPPEQPAVDKPEGTAVVWNYPEADPTALPAVSAIVAASQQALEVALEKTEQMRALLTEIATLDTSVTAQHARILADQLYTVYQKTGELELKLRSRGA